MGIYLGKNKISMFGGTHKVTEGIDTSDGNITENDVLNGKVAYSNGERIIGNIPNYNGTDMQYESAIKDGNNAAIRVSTDERFAICPDDTGKGYIDVNIPLVDFGDATPADVSSEKYFTSKDGIKIRGNLQEGVPFGNINISQSDGSTIISGTIFKYGYDSIGVTIAPLPRILYKTAKVVNGRIVLSSPYAQNKIMATTQRDNYQNYPYFYGDLGDGSNDPEVYKYTDFNIETDIFAVYKYTYYHQYVNNNINISRVCDNDIIVRNGVDTGISISASDFGSATPADVLAGKTFTSLSGMKVTGTGAQAISSTSGKVADGATEIDTGLFEVKYIAMFKIPSDVKGVGIVHAQCTNSGVANYIYCSSYTSNNNYELKLTQKNIFEFDGGIVRLRDSSINTDAISGCRWDAYGKKKS